MYHSFPPDTPDLPTRYDKENVDTRQSAHGSMKREELVFPLIEENATQISNDCYSVPKKKKLNLFARRFLKTITAAFMPSCTSMA